MNKVIVNQPDNNQRLIISIKGELDASNCIPAEREFTKAMDSAASSIYVDCRDLTYISSAGVGVLISLHHSCTQKGIPIYFCGLQPRVLNVFEILGLDHLFKIESSLDEAEGTTSSSELKS